MRSSSSSRPASVLRARRSAGFTSPSSRIRRRGCRAASCCSAPACSCSTRTRSAPTSGGWSSITSPGLGFGLGFAHATLPPALVDEARELDFPLFGVPYEMPFIAITERAFSSLLNEQLDVLQRAVSIQRRMERLVLDERSLGEVVRGLANSIGATVMVLDSAGRTLACHAFRRELDAGLIAAIGAEIASRAGDRVTPRLRAPERRAGRSRDRPAGAERLARGALVVAGRRARERQRRRLRALSRAPRGDGRGARPDARARRRGDRAPARRRRARPRARRADRR